MGVERTENDKTKSTSLAISNYKIQRQEQNPAILSSQTFSRLKTVDRDLDARWEKFSLVTEENEFGYRDS